MSTTDWNLIIQGNLSLIWCQLCMKPENKDKTIKQLLNDFKSTYESIEPLNIGSLFMASYILFVYPKESDYKAIDFSKIDTSCFTVKEGTSNSNKDRFCCRIRNSLTHSRFSIEGDRISFLDYKKNEKDLFKASISIHKFGEFINNFMHEVKKQYFQR